MLRITNLVHGTLIAAVVAGVLIASIGFRSDPDIDHGRRSSRLTDLELRHAAEDSGSATELHAVQIRKPAGPPMIELSETDPLGRSGKIACSTCHSVRAANLENKTDDTLNEFHVGLKVDHGKIACYACHHATESDSLRLADGSALPYQEVMTMCSQCHGPQATAFAKGAHGGMNGYWDLSRGPQTKNNCVDCHDPHQPSFPKMIVGFKPRDRFLDQEVDHDEHE